MPTTISLGRLSYVELALVNNLSFVTQGITPANMLPNLPFAALRNFESVARLRSFVRAAEELGATQSAVSQRVKSLEDWIGRKLLVRGARGTVPTSEGQLLADTIAQGAGQIAVLCEMMRHGRREDRAITVSCPPGFAVNWLFPRLINFDQSCPDTPLSISANPSSVIFFNGEADAAISYGMGDHPGLHVERLMGERVFPVCAPSLLENGPRLVGVDDLRLHTFLLDELADIGGEPPTWAFWAEQTDQTLPVPARTRRFSQANMVVQAAIQGQGVALGREPLVIDALREGALVRPLPGIAISNFSYWFVCPQGALRHDRIRRFRDWLFAEQTRQPVLDFDLADAAA